MKMCPIVILTLILVMGSTWNGTSYSAEPPDSAQNHLALAQLYRESALVVQSTLIEEHMKMKHLYPRQLSTVPETTAPEKIQEMENRCDAIISDATKLRNHLLDFARWHKRRAEELREMRYAKMSEVMIRRNR